MSAKYGIDTLVPLTRLIPTMASITPTVLPAGSTNNYAPVDASTGVSFGLVQIIRQATDAAGSTLTGLDTTRIEDGQYTFIENLGPGALTLAHESLASTDVNRFTLPSSSLALPVGASVMLIRDGATTRWRVGSTAGGGSGGITNSAGADVLMKSDGTNAVSSSAVESAAEFAIDTDTFRLFKLGKKIVITHPMMAGSGIPGMPHGSVVVYTTGAGVGPTGAGDDGGVQSFVSTTFNLGPGEPAQSLAFYAGNSASRIGPNGTLTNYGVLANVTGGDANWAWYAVNGAMYQREAAQFDGLVSFLSLTAAGQLTVDGSGNVSLGQKVQSFRVEPPPGVNANISLGGAYVSGCQLTTKNRVSGVNFAGVDIGLDTTVQASIGGGLHIWRGAGGGFGGANEGGIAFAGTNGNYIVGSTVGDLCVFNTTPSRKMLFSSDGSAWSIGAQLDGAGLFQAKTLMTGSTMGTGSKWLSGTGDPNGVVTGNIGDLYSRRDGGAGTSLYVKEAGNGTNTGWVGK